MIATILIVDDDRDFEGLAAASPLPVLLTPIPQWSIMSITSPA
jgi:hypothetical protein